MRLADDELAPRLNQQPQRINVAGGCHSAPRRATYLPRTVRRGASAPAVSDEEVRQRGLLAGLELHVGLELGTDGAASLDAVFRSGRHEITMANADHAQLAAERATSTDLRFVEIAAFATNLGVQTQFGALDTNLTNRQGLAVRRSQATMQAGFRIARRKRQQHQGAQMRKNAGSKTPARLTCPAMTLSRTR